MYDNPVAEKVGVCVKTIRAATVRECPLNLGRLSKAGGTGLLRGILSLKADSREDGHIAARPFGRRICAGAA